MTVSRLGDAGQVHPCSTTEVPGPDLEALRLLGSGRNGRVEASEIAIWPFSQASPKSVAQVVEAGVLRVSRPVRVFAEHDLGLLGVQLEAQGPQALGNGGPQVLGLFLGITIRDNVVDSVPTESRGAP